jgi:hypothetical protein
LKKVQNLCTIFFGKNYEIIIKNIHKVVYNSIQVKYTGEFTEEDNIDDEDLMVDGQEGYDVLTGGVDVNNPSNDKYGEVHTGDAWIPARDRYCSNPQGPTMPVG